jgi:hypothetical protein
VEVVFWFHPLVWWASRRASLAREFACDDAAIGSRSDIANYLRTLLKVAEQASHGGSQAPLAREDVDAPRKGLPLLPLKFVLVSLAAGVMWLWLPIDILASPRAAWSPWPSWSAQVLHDFGIHARDFDAYDSYSRPNEMRERETMSDSTLDAPVSPITQPAQKSVAADAR